VQAVARARCPIARARVRSPASTAASSMKVSASPKATSSPFSPERINCAAAA
jgi:hypothetical protein